MKPLVLITDDAHPLLAETLTADGFEVHFRPDITREHVLEQIAGYTGLIVNSRITADKELLQRATSLRFVGRLGSGLEVIDLEYAKAHNIYAFNAPEGNKQAVAEHALGMLLCLMNNIAIANDEVKQGLWLREKNRGTELQGKTVGLIAYGQNARAFAGLLKPFGVHVLAYDKYLHNFSDGNVKEATIEEIQQQADILSLHLPLTQETYYMVNEAFLNGFAKPYWLVNTSRGKVMDTKAMLTALQKGKIIAAALDVLENEKIDTYSAAEKQLFQNLTNEKRVLLTPHIAGWTHESKRKIAEQVIAKIRNSTAFH